MNEALKTLDFYNGVNLSTLTTFIPEARTFDDIIVELKSTFANGKPDTTIIKLSKSSFKVEFTEGLTIYAGFHFSTATKQVKRIV